MWGLVCSQFIDVWMIYLVHEPDRRGLVRISIGEFDVDLPNSAFIQACHCCTQVRVMIINFQEGLKHIKWSWVSKYNVKYFETCGRYEEAYVTFKDDHAIYLYKSVLHEPNLRVKTVRHRNVKHFETCGHYEEACVTFKDDHAIYLYKSVLHEPNLRVKTVRHHNVKYFKTCGCYEEVYVTFKDDHAI